jgi:uncharacterized membrane protein
MAIQENPYLPPVARVEDAEIVRGGYVDGGRAVPPGHGWQWIVSGWATFRQQPGTWIILTFVLGILVILISLIPLVGSLGLPLLMPAFVAGLMIACEKSERGEIIAFADLFSAFQRGAARLVLLGLIGFGLTIAALIPALVVLFAVGFSLDATSPSSFALVILFYLALLLPVYMAIWFGPPLVGLHDLEPTRAIGQSFRGCLRNVMPFLVYSAVLVPLAVVASLPVFLGWLVLGPVIVASTYAAYRDIFFRE